MQEIMRRYERLAARDSCVVVEGAGGLLVPMGKDWDMRDLIGRIGLPVVLVGRAGLGGINHALLTLEGLRQRHCAVMAVVLNETALSTTPRSRSSLRLRSRCCGSEPVFRCWVRCPISHNLALIGPAPSRRWHRAA